MTLLRWAAQLISVAMGRLDENDREQDHAKQDLAEVRSLLRQIDRRLQTK